MYRNRYFVYTPLRSRSDPSRATSPGAVEYAIKNSDETAQIMVKHNPTMNLDTVKTQWAGTIK